MSERNAPSVVAQSTSIEVGKVNETVDGVGLDCSRHYGDGMDVISPMHPGWLGNPYKVGEDGDRADVIQKFAADLDDKLETDEEFRDAFSKIPERVDVLQCHCRRTDESEPACHCDVIKARAQQFADDDSDDDDELPDDPARLDPTYIDGVGGERAKRLDSVLDITTVSDVAAASVESLKEVSSIGSMTAKRVKGRAQGITNAYDDYLYPDDDELDTMTEEVRPTGSAKYGDAPSRVAVVFGEGLDGLDSLALRDLVGDALEQIDIPVYDELQVGYVAGWSADDPYGEMGGRLVRDWIDEQLALGTMVDDKESHTPWTKYAMAWNREEAEPYWQTWDYDSAPADEPTELSDIPFATPRGWQDVDTWMAPAERTRDLVGWAQEVVIVTDGEYADSLRYECQAQGVPCTTAFGEPIETGRGNFVVDEYIPLKKRDVGPDEKSTIAGRAGWTYVTDDDGDILFDEAGNPLTRQVDDDEYEASKEWREGSPNDLEAGEVLDIGLTTRDEHWPDTDTGTAGGGVGSKSDREGEYRDSLL